MKIDPNFQTPLEVCRYMVEMVPREASIILEPTPGLGNIVTTIKDHSNYQQYNWAVLTPKGGDFFLLEKERVDCVVMNPPFSSKYAFMDNAPRDFSEKGMRLGYFMLTECMKMSDCVIALMPWFTISDSDVRLRFLKNWGLKSITALPRKTFQYARIQTCVLELRKDYKKETIFKTFNF